MDGIHFNYSPEKHDQHRRSIKIWFRGYVTTIGNAERILIHEEIDRQIEEQGISREYKFKMIANRSWQSDFLRSINWDPWQKYKRVED